MWKRGTTFFGSCCVTWFTVTCVLGIVLLSFDKSLPGLCAPVGSGFQETAISGLNVAGFSSGLFSQCLSHRLHGIAVIYIPHKMITEKLIESYKNSSTPPTLVGPPQSTFVTTLIDQGHALPLAPDVRSKAEYLGLNVFERNGQSYSFKDSVESVKSLVFYRTDLFDRHSLKPPETIEDFEQLVKDIKATSALYPFCFSIYSGDATGWVGTDWSENYILARGMLDNWTSSADVNETYAASANEWVKNLVVLNSDPKRHCRAWKTQIEDLQNGNCFMTLTLSSIYFEKAVNEDANIAWFPFPELKNRLIVGNTYNIAFTNKYLSDSEVQERARQTDAYYTLSLTEYGASMKMDDGAAKRGEVSLVKGALFHRSRITRFREFSALVRGAYLFSDPTDTMTNYKDHWAYWREVVCPT